MLNPLTSLLLKISSSVKPFPKWKNPLLSLSINALNKLFEIRYEGYLRSSITTVVLRVSSKSLDISSIADENFVFFKSLSNNKLSLLFCTFNKA